MVIRPVLPDQKPDSNLPSTAPTLPFRKTSDFLRLLKAAVKNKANATAAPSVHTVARGESLWRICEDALKAQGTTPTKCEVNRAVSQVTRSNHLKNANVLSIGQSLDLSALRTPAVASTPAAAVIPDLSRVIKSETLPDTVAGKVAPLEAVAPAAIDANTLRTPVAALSPNIPDAKGGGESLARPLFTKLSNARPSIHASLVRAAAASTAPAEAATEPVKAVDLTALMQSILEPGSVAADTPVASSPWSKLVGGAGRFTSGFGVRTDPFTGKPQFHQGIDIATASGTEIYPYMPGKVKAAGWDPGYGKFVTVEHPNGLETMYAHASETLVKAGDIVMKDTPIAKVGTTGRSTGPHLHFEVHQNHKAIDPMPFVKDASLDVAKAL